MPEVRSIAVSLNASVSGYVANMRRAGLVTKQFGAEAAAAAAISQESAAKSAKAWEPIGKVGKIFMGFGVAAAAGLGVAAKYAADFDAQMSIVKANVDDTSDRSMKKLRDAALDAGEKMSFTSKEAAEAETELAKAGLSAAQITGGALLASMNLAAAGQIGLGESAEYTSSTMVQFGLNAKDAGHIADVLAAGADKSLGGVEDLAEGLKYAGVNAHQFGMSVDDTVGVLAMFASNGIKGSMAGTSLRMMLVRLSAPTKEAKNVLDKYNISAFDAQGNFVGMAGLAQQLHDKLGPLNQKTRQAALSTIFGARSLSEANILMKEGGAAVDDWTKKVNDQGFAAKQAATKLDNLKGDLILLKSAFDNTMIGIGENSQGPLRKFTQLATSAFTGFNHLPDTLQSVATGGLAATAALGLLGGGALVLIPKIASTVTAVKELNTWIRASNMAALAGELRLGSYARAAGAAGIAVGTLYAAGKLMEPVWDLNAKGAHQAAASLESYLKAGRDGAEVTRLQKDEFLDLGNTVRLQFQSGLWGNVKNAFSWLGNLGGIAGPTGRSEAHQFFDEIDTGLAKLVQQGKKAKAEKIFETIAKEAKKQGITIAQLKDAFPQYFTQLDTAAKKNEILKQKTRQVGNEMKNTGPKMDAFGNKLEDEEGKAISARDAIDNLSNSIRGLGSTALDASDAEIAFRQAIADATKTAKDNKHTLDLNTQSGLENRSALNQIARSSHDYTAALVENNASQKKVTDSIKEGRRWFIKTAMSMGATREQAKKLADQAGFTQKDIDRVTASLKTVAKQHPKPTVTAQTSQAMKNIDEFRHAITTLPDKTVDVNARFKAENLFGGSYAGTPGLGGPWKNSADGSTVAGPRHPYGDKVPYLLAPGEEVISNRYGQADRNRALLKKINAGQDVGYMPGLAGGGTVLRPGHMSYDVNSYLDHFIADKGPAMWKKFFGAFMAAGGPHFTGGYKAIEAMISRAVWGSIVTSDYRPGARTQFGNLSRHAMGKAVDYAPTKRLWDFLYPRRGQFYELLGPWGMFLRGAPYHNASVQALHRNHIHVSAYARGTQRAAPGYAWVGERGPELVKFDGRERVWSNREVNAGRTPAGAQITYRTQINATSSEAREIVRAWNWNMKQQQLPGVYSYA